MRIIKTGKVEYKVEKFTCLRCGTIFEAGESEYTHANQMEYMHDGIRIKCQCPLCGNMVYKG